MSNFLKIFPLFIIFVLLNSYPAYCELDYDYTDLYSIPIKLSPIEEISTKSLHNYGETVEFKVVEDVWHNNKKLLKSGDIVKAQLEICITSGMNGFPAEIIIDNFNIPNINHSKLLDTYIKAGQNRCLIVYPIKWALTPIPFVGSLTNFIKGGHAKLKKTDEIVIYYYPNWK